MVKMDIGSVIKEYPNCNILIWQVAVMLDARRMTGDEDDFSFMKGYKPWENLIYK